MSEPQTLRAADRRAFRIGLCAILMIVVGQGLYPSRHGEPYPAIKMPTFAGSGGYRGEGIVKVPRWTLTFEGQGEPKTVEGFELLQGFPGSHRSRIADHAFHPRVLRASAEPKAPNAVDARLSAWRDRLFPGHARSRRLQGGPEALASIRAFLRARAKALAPTLEVERVRMRWFTETHALESPGAPIATSPATEFSLELAEAAR